MTRLLIGPVLRHVGSTDATVWVETDAPCEVSVLGHREHTWTVGGHHYALVHVQDLTPDAATPYEVALDGERAWPPADGRWPASCSLRAVITCIRWPTCRLAAVGSKPT